MKRWILVSLMFTTLVLAACGGSSTPTASAPQEISLEAADIKFSAAKFEVTANQPIRLILKNSGTLDHDFTISEISVKDVSMARDMGMGGHDMADMPDLHIALRPKGTGVLTFTPTVPGTYEFQCSVSGHKEAGMTGTLVVK